MYGILQHLIWVYIVCKGLSVPIFTVITVLFFFLFQNILCVVFITCLFDEEFEINKVQNKKGRCFSVKKKKKKEILCVIEVAPLKLILLCI